MRAAEGDSDIFSDVSRHGDRRRGSVVSNCNGGVRHHGLVHPHLIHFAEREGFAHRRKRSTVRERHYARLRSREEVGHITHLHVECLGIDVQRNKAQSTKEC